MDTEARVANYGYGAVHEKTGKRVWETTHEEAAQAGHSKSLELQLRALRQKLASSQESLDKAKGLIVTFSDEVANASARIE